MNGDALIPRALSASGREFRLLAHLRRPAAPQLWPLAGVIRTSASDCHTIAILGSPQRAPQRTAGSKTCAIDCTDFVQMTQAARPTIGCSVGLGGASMRAHNRVGLESGILSICGNDRDVGDAGSRARNPALERNHWGQRVRFEGKGDERQRLCVGNQAAWPSADKTEPTQGAARRAAAIPTTPTIPIVSPYGRSTPIPSADQALQPRRGLGETKVKHEEFRKRTLGRTHGISHGKPRAYVAVACCARVFACLLA
jgi:hypothetical protein